MMVGACQYLTMVPRRPGGRSGVREGRNAWAAWSNVGGGLPPVIDSHSLSRTGWHLPRKQVTTPLKGTDMVGDLFDSPWKVLIIAVVLIVLFGSRKLPHAARSLGQSMRILKKEVSDLHHDEPGTEAQAAPRATVGPPAPLAEARAPVGQQTQIAALQQQVRDLQRADAMDVPAPTVQAGACSEPQRTPQPS